MCALGTFAHKSLPAKTWPAFSAAFGELGPKVLSALLTKPHRSCKALNPAVVAFNSPELGCVDFGALHRLGDKNQLKTYSEP